MVVHQNGKYISLILGVLSLGLLFVIACGGAEAPAQAPVKTTAAVSAPAPAAAKTSPGADKPTPQPTAHAALQSPNVAPTAVPTAVPEAEIRETVVTKLILSVVPPINQVTMQYRTAMSSGGPMRPGHEYLLGLDRTDGHQITQLATKWEVGKDFKSWRWHLNEGIEFHDGSLLTAKDVPFSWSLITGDDSVATGRKTMRLLFESQDSFEIVNDHEFVMHTARAALNLPYYWSDDIDMQIESKDYWDKVGEEGYAAHPVGTGPYRFVEFTEGVGMSYERVEDHWRKTAPFPEIEILYTPEDVTRVAQLLAGEVHVSTIPRGLKNQVTSQGKKIIKATLPSFQVLAFIGGQYLDDAREADDPMNNLLVRKALNLAINREEINEEIFGGAGEIMSVHSFSPYLTGDAYDSSWTPYPYDPEQARELLKEAGYPNGFKQKMLSFNASGVPELPQVAEAFYTYFRAIGLEPEIESTTFGKTRERYRSRSLHRTLFPQRTSATPTFRLWPVVYGSDAVGTVVHGYEVPEVDEIWLKYAGSTDAAERKRLLRWVGQNQYDNYYSIPLLFLFGEIAVDPDVIEDYVTNMLLYGPLRNLEYIEPVYK